MRAFLRGGIEIFDRVAAISLLEAIAPLCGLAFALPVLLAAAPGLWSALARAQLASCLTLILLSSLALGGGSLLALVLMAWARLAMVEVSLSPEMPASRALAEGARILGDRLSDLLRFGLVLIPLFAVPGLVYLLILLLCSVLGSSDLVAPIVSAAQILIDLLFTLVSSFLVVAAHVGFILLCLSFRGMKGDIGALLSSEGSGEGALLLSPRPGSAREVGELYLAMSRASSNEEEPKEGAASVHATTTELPPYHLILENVFCVEEILRAVSSSDPKSRDGSSTPGEREEGEPPP